MNPGIFKAIAEKKVLEDGIKSDLTRILGEFKQKFVADRQAVTA